ncbi:anti-sigma factor [Luteirhabdus pelagi]|uniref:anti-sigma factor n=1 Tax=Luteirhabdus pelagi TaxID=2792783 RepID=UPI0019397BE3|nr:anti-sigma factor [Luteirhabdus pelagi]
MKDNRNIDEVFKQGFEGHAPEPSPEVWNNIQQQLDAERKDRKVIPLWWKAAGVAALIALIFLIGDKLVWDDTSSPLSDTDSVEEVQQDAVEQKQDNVTEPASSKKDSSEGVASEEKDAENTTENESSINNEAVASETTRPVSTSTERKKAQNASQNTSVAQTDNRTVQKGEKDKTFGMNQIENAKETIAATDTKTTNTKDNNPNSQLPKEKAANSENTEVETAVAETETDAKKESEKQSIFDAIEESKNTEDAVAKSNKPNKRWEVAPNVAPVYYSSFGEGSSIDPMFADNSKTGEVNISYGVQVAYNISDRLSVRTGINNVELGYSTGEIDLGTGPVAFSSTTIDYGSRQTGDVIIPVDKGALSMANQSGDFANVTPKSTGGNAELFQNIRYYEVPLELKYAVVNKHFGVHLIGGMSTLFLGDNEISVEDGGFSSVLGEANNLNSVSFATNAGVGLSYRFSNTFKFNIEPMFKYQLNPYTDNSVRHRPYYLGVYSGFSLSF